MRTTVLIASLLISTVAVAAPRPVVMELFTSQGCSSCPPADRLLSKLGGERFDGAIIIPLAFHVDYWNSLGWTDPFSSSRWSQRQSSYASAMHSSQVYTPQLILNGTAQMVGSDERHVRGEIEKMLKEPAHGQVAIRQIGDHLQLDASLARDAAGDSDVFVVFFENSPSTAVQRGENAGRRLTNDYVVRSMVPAFAIRPGQSITGRPVAFPADSRNLRAAALVQDRRTLAIYAGAVQ